MTARLKLLVCACAVMASQTVLADPDASRVRVCIYGSKSYSEGADLCIQKSLLMNCSLESGRPVWKVVADKELSSLCAIPSERESARPPRTRARHEARDREVPHHRPVAARMLDKCFTFQGKRFCE
jgi:hypothetical protein